MRKIRNISLIFLVLVIFLFSSTVPSLAISNKKGGSNNLLGIVGLCCALYGLQANTETFEWDFLIERYVSGSGKACLLYTSPSPRDS